MSSQPNQHRIQQLLEEALDSHRTPEDVCRDEPELLSFVRRRWEQVRSVEAQIDALFPSSGPTRFGRRPVFDAEAELPQIPGYQVEHVLGHGGVGVVYKARHLKLNRAVALKMLLAGHFAAPQDLAHFRREAQAVAGLRHAHIVQVYDVGELDDRPYFTMEFLDGGDLARKLAGTPQPARDAAAMVAVLASAVQAAHAGGIVHRDLKPANILLTSDGALKITDFGLAWRFNVDAAANLMCARVGTPSYMSPEQAAGKASAFCPLVDVYSLGAMLYEMLTGRPPFRAESTTETQRQVISDDPVRPSRLNSRVPKDLETICLKCLQKEPARRYANAQELADDLQRFQNGEPVRARPVSFVERCFKWARRRPSAAALVAVTALLVTAAIATGAWLQHMDAIHQAETALRKGRGRQAIESALGMAQLHRENERWREGQSVLDGALASANDADDPALLKRLRRARADLALAERLEKIREDRAISKGDAFSYSDVYYNYDNAFRDAGFQINGDTAATAAKINASSIRSQLLDALIDWAFVDFVVNEEAKRARLLEIARTADPDPGWRDRFRTPETWRNLDALLKLLDDADSNGVQTSPHELTILGVLLGRLGDDIDCESLLRDAQRSRPGDFWLNWEMANALLRQSRNAEALPYMRAACAIKPNSSGVHNGLAIVYNRLGNSEEAIHQLRIAIAIDPQGTFSRANLVLGLCRQGLWKQASEAYGDSIKNVPASSRPAADYASMLWSTRQYEKSLDIYSRLMKLNPGQFEPAYAVAACLASLRRYHDAHIAYENAIKLDPSQAKAYAGSAAMLLRLGNAHEAVSRYQDALLRQATHSDWMSGLGDAQRAVRDDSAAAASYRQAIHLNTHLWSAHKGLVNALLCQSNFGDARTAAQQWLTSAGSDARQKDAAAAELELCNRLFDIQVRTPDVISGKAIPDDSIAQRAIAVWYARHLHKYAEAVELFEKLFDAQPALANDPRSDIRFRAARAAVASGWNQTKVAPAQAERFRVLALKWLADDYTMWSRIHAGDEPELHARAARRMQEWLDDDGLRCTRDAAACAGLTPLERSAWQALWEKVTALAAESPDRVLKVARTAARCRDWSKAAAEYEHFLKLSSSSDSEIWFEYAAAQLLSGDKDGYRRTCAHMLDPGQKSGPMRAYLVARAHTLAPEPHADLVRVERLAENEILGNPSEHWALAEQGALCCRNGQTKDAIDELVRADAANASSGTTIVNHMWLALAYEKSGHHVEARRILARADAWLDQYSDGMPVNSSDFGLHLHNWLEANALRQELDPLIGRK